MSQERIKLVKGQIPILFLSGAKDELVPPEHMKTLFELSDSTFKPIRFVSFPNGTHNDTFMQPNYFDVIVDFLKGL